MEQKAVELKRRTKSFALRVIKLVRALPPCAEAKVIGYQLLRSGTSVAANYRAVCRARSRAEFLSKLAIVIEEADESELWLEMISEAELMPENRLKDLKSEANQIVAILNTARTTARRNSRSRIKQTTTRRDDDESESGVGQRAAIRGGR